MRNRLARIDRALQPVRRVASPIPSVALICAAGYKGGYSQVKEFVRQIRPGAVPEPVVRFETPPGRQAQVDFAEFRLPWGKRYALFVVLSYSRRMWLQFYPRQSMEVLLHQISQCS